MGHYSTQGSQEKQNQQYMCGVYVCVSVCVHAQTHIHKDTHRKKLNLRNWYKQLWRLGKFKIYM